MDSVTKNAKAIFPYEEAVAKTKEYFKGDELAASVWINKYAMKDSFGNLYECTPEDMHRRLAAEFARIEKKYPNPMSEDEIFQLFDKFKYVIPQGGPMSSIGNVQQIASLSNCFVIGHEKPADSYGGIMKIDEEAGPVDETTRRCRTRSFPHKARRFAGVKLGTYLYRGRSVHGRYSIPQGR